MKKFGQYIRRRVAVSTKNEVRYLVTLLRVLHKELRVFKEELRIWHKNLHIWHKLSAIH